MRMHSAFEPKKSDFLSRLERRKQIVAQVIDGLLGLREAARQFRRLQPSFSCPTGSEPRTLESVCRMLIGWARLALADQPERAEQVADHLEEQLPAAS